MEAIFLVCGAGGPQLKRNPLGSIPTCAGKVFHMTPIPLLLLCLAAPQATDSQAAVMYAAVINQIAKPEHDSLVLVDSSYLTTLKPGGLAPLPRLQTKATLQLVSRAEVTDSLGYGKVSVATYWRRFAKRFPGARAWVALGPIQFRADSSGALVYYEVHCGGLCGEGVELTLLKKAESWIIADRRRLWVS